MTAVLLRLPPSSEERGADVRFKGGDLGPAVVTRARVAFPCPGDPRPELLVGTGGGTVWDAKRRGGGLLDKARLKDEGEGVILGVLEERVLVLTAAAVAAGELGGRGGSLLLLGLVVLFVLEGFDGGVGER